MRMTGILTALGLAAAAGGGAAWWWLARGGGVRVELEPRPPSITVAESLRLTGRAVGGEPSLRVDGTPVTLAADGRFEHAVPLRPGDNTVTLALTARPEAGGPPETRTEALTVKRVDVDTYDSEYFYVASGSLRNLSRGPSSLKAVRDAFLTGDVDVTLKAAELTGAVLEEYGTDNRPVKGGMPMLVDVSVGGGAVRVALRPEEGPVVAAVARPGAPVTVRGRSELHLGKYIVRLEALDGGATDVVMRVRY